MRQQLARAGLTVLWCTRHMTTEFLRLLLKEAQVKHVVKSALAIVPRHMLEEAETPGNFIGELLLALHPASPHEPR
jgi:hypothetical protein